jgi:hypothetical protein
MALANERHHEYTTLEHLLLALVDDQDVAAVMRGCNVDVEKLRRDLASYGESQLGDLVTDRSEDSKPTAGFQRSIQHAVIRPGLRAARRLRWLYNNDSVGRKQAVVDLPSGVAIGVRPDERPESYRNDNDAQATQNETQGPDRRNVKRLSPSGRIEYRRSTEQRAETGQQQESTYNA